jgi:hypothetical protein
MKKNIILLNLLPLILGCSAPPSGTFDLTVKNKTNITLIDCDKWHRISADVIKSTCLFDNQNKAEMRALSLVAHDENDSVIGRSPIGKVTIGEKLKINKSMTIKPGDIPVLMTLEAAE